MGLHESPKNYVVDTLTTGIVGTAALGGTHNLFDHFTAIIGGAAAVFTAMGQLLIVAATLYSLLKKKTLHMPLAKTKKVPPCIDEKTG